MAVYLKPSINLPIFNVDNYEYQDKPITYKQGDQRYLKKLMDIIAETSAGVMTLRLTETAPIADSEGNIAGYSTAGIFQSNLVAFLSDRIRFSIAGARVAEMRPAGVVAMNGGGVSKAWFRNVPNDLVPIRAIDLIEVSATPNNYAYRSFAIGLDVSRYVMVASTGGVNDRAINRATTGTSWSTVSTTLALSYVKVIFVPELRLFIAISDSGDVNDVMVSSTSGTSWSHIAIGAGNFLQDICYSPGLGIIVIAGRSTGTRFFYSTSGTSWSAGTYPGAPNITCLCWDPINARFVAVEPNRSYFSTDGINWTDNGAGSAPTNPLRRIIYVEALDLYVSVGLAGRTFYSSDGINWLSGPQVTFNTFNALDWSPDFGVVCAVTNEELLYSFNGINWAMSNTPVLPGAIYNDCVYSARECRFYLAMQNNASNNSGRTRSVGLWN